MKKKRMLRITGVVAVYTEPKFDFEKRLQANLSGQFARINGMKTVLERLCGKFIATFVGKDYA
ncbi:MAG: hypothetical protein IJM54_06755, partial [Thermoguttaceae bacterium]|nr:hypothetical protein [Thermoguttaceae bacterium]